MADYTAAANAALTDLLTGIPVEEYEVTKLGRRVRRGKPEEQVRAAILLDALAARSANGIFRLAKFRNPRA